MAENHTLVLKIIFGENDPFVRLGLEDNVCFSYLEFNQFYAENFMTGLFEQLLVMWSKDEDLMGFDGKAKRIVVESIKKKYENWKKNLKELDELQKEAEK